MLVSASRPMVVLERIYFCQIKQFACFDITGSGWRGIGGLTSRSDAVTTTAHLLTCVLVPCLELGEGGSPSPSIAP